MTDIKSLSPAEIKDLLAELSAPSFHAKQIFKWLHSGVSSFDEMTDLSKPLRRKLSEQCHITSLRCMKKQVSAMDGTVKYLWALDDGNCVESVVMCYEHGNTVCVSSQVGCKMGCAFCASTKKGFVRDLMPSEILDQIIFSQADSGKKISNIVMMGIGEPLDNFDNVLKFLQLVNDPLGINIGMRHISLSTCGLVDKVDKLSSYNLQLTLSVSLHAPDNETRSALMPVNNRYDVDSVLAASERYFKKTGRRVSFEYLMADGVNDSEYHAGLLSRKLKGTGSHVNLIPLNEVAESPLHPSSPGNLKAFTDILKQNGINVTVRRRLGADIDASCGQLRYKTI